MRAILLAALLVLVPALPAHAAKTVCTITVNSDDEKEAMRARLPKGEYRFVELIEKNRPDWLRSSCERQVQCDVLVVSGHFNAGDDFYSDKLGNDTYLRVDELERASCSASCPSLFAKLKEVYLFGCESLNPRPGNNAGGESSRDRMRRIFAGVPVIYGFSSSAPVGPTASMLLNKYFDGAPRNEIGSGRTSSRLLSIFARNSMAHTSGVRPDDAYARERAAICPFFDDRLAAAAKVRYVHTLLRRERLSPEFFERIENLFAQMTEEERRSPGFDAALAEIAADDASRERYLAAVRATRQAPLRARMVAMAGTFGWLTPEAQARERVALVNDLLASNAMGYAEVELVCALNADGALDGRLAQVRAPAGRPPRAAESAALACLGSDAARAQVLRALASADDREVQAAQAYLRHRPLEDKAQLRAVAAEIAQMPGTPAKVRALDALGRLNIADRQVLEELARAFAEAKSLPVQRAIAEVFIRSDPAALPRQQLADVVRRHRLPARGRGEDLIDVLLDRLQAAS